MYIIYSRNNKKVLAEFALNKYYLAVNYAKNNLSKSPIIQKLTNKNQDIETVWKPEWVNNTSKVSMKHTLLKRTPSKKSSTGIAGVYKSFMRDKKDKSKIIPRWVARISLYGSEVNLGYFYNIEDAIKIRQEAEKTYYDVELKDYLFRVDYYYNKERNPLFYKHEVVRSYDMVNAIKILKENNYSIKKQQPEYRFDYVFISSEPIGDK